MKYLCEVPLRTLVGVVVGIVLLLDALMVWTILWMFIQLIGWY